MSNVNIDKQIDRKEVRQTRSKIINPNTDFENRPKLVTKSPTIIHSESKIEADSFHNAEPFDLQLFEHQLDSSNSFQAPGTNENPSEQPLLKALARKRELKGSYKAKLSLEKLIIEHERKKMHLQLLQQKYDKLKNDLEDIGSEFVHKLSREQFFPQKDQSTSRTHLEFLFKEMHWMQEDFEREHKKKQYDAKKSARMCRKELAEHKLKKEKQLKDQQAELRRKANTISKMVTVFWKSVDKVVRHNYTAQIEQKRQQARAKKLESFVSKHLKLSVRVAEELNTKSFVQQSMYKDEHGNPITHQESLRQQVKIYDSQTGFEDLQNSENKQMTTLADMTVKMAEAFQPAGIDLQSANVLTKVPFLLHGSLREYQIIGLDWLVTLHNKRLNGILADEMGLGKTIQTISLLASLACDRGIWGPHLIVVPTTIMINWEMEFKRWCPSLKVLTYYGSQKERKLKRQGWSKDNSFHVCITSYKLVIQDHFVFRRKKWYYMVLDEAQNIKNFKSQRWQTLLRFNTRRRLLLTGTPLQNDVMELWSLMHFLMPQIFSSQQDFKEWFSNPFSQSINQNQSLNLGVVQKLQSILRPFLLRRMKRDVEKQLPEKIEHIVQCTLSRRQRLLYDEYINNDKTQSTLVNSDFFSIMNVLMQLRKVCNHPDLFEQRTIDSPFIMTNKITFECPSIIYNFTRTDPLQLSLEQICHFPTLEMSMSRLQADSIKELYPSQTLQAILSNPKYLNPENSQNLYLTVPQILPHNPPIVNHKHPYFISAAALPFVHEYYNQQQNQDYKSYFSQKSSHIKKIKQLITLAHADIQNRKQILIKSSPIYGTDLRRAVQITMPMSFDATSRQPQLYYVNRNTKNKNFDFYPPSTVFNPFIRSQPNRVIVTDITGSDYSVKNGELIQEIQRIKLTESKQEVDIIPKFREVIIETVQAGPPGIHGVIIEVNLARIHEQNITTADCLTIFSLRSVQEIIQQPLTQSDESSEPTQIQVQDVAMSDDEDDGQDEADEKRRAEEAYQQTRIQQDQDYQILPKFTDALRELVQSPQYRITIMEDSIKYFKCIIPKVVAKTPQFIPSRVDTQHSKSVAYERFAYQKLMSHRTVTQSLKWSNILFFPHKNLVQYDCGKLQRLAQLLKNLYLKGSKVLIFTQMTRMLDILEQFLNLHGYTYVRLDGSVKVEARQKMVDRFNLSPKIFCFISSTRCGGIGINLTGADCVIFYDTDWNPAMDKQAQDRSHRIGQTKTVHIYRLISVNTVEENIFKKSLQKRELGSLIIAGEAFDSKFFQRASLKDLLNQNLLMPKLKAKNIMQEENIIFHHQNQSSITNDNIDDDMGRQKDLEAYRQKFEEAMIRIEDEEDIEAYKEAKAELDDEFKELEADEATGIVPDKQDEEDVHMEQEVGTKKEQAGDFRKNEKIDWRNNQQLNQVTKMAIQAFEKEFTFEDFMKEKDEKEGKKEEGFESGDGQDDIEEEEDLGVVGWDREWAQRMFFETQEELTKQIQ